MPSRLAATPWKREWCIAYQAISGSCSIRRDRRYGSRSTSSQEFWTGLLEGATVRRPTGTFCGPTDALVATSYQPASTVYSPGGIWLGSITICTSCSRWFGRHDDVGL